MRNIIPVNTIAALMLAMACVMGASAEEPAKATTLDDFAPFIGSWESEGDQKLQFAMRAVRGGKLLMFIERGSFGGDRLFTFAEGFIGKNPANQNVLSRVFFIQRDYMADGVWSRGANGALVNDFTAHYGEGWGTVEAGSKVRFRDTWTPITEDRWKWQTEIFRDDEWRPLSEAVLNRFDQDLFAVDQREEN